MNERENARAAGPLICLHDVKKRYHTPAGAVAALRGIDLTIEAGEFVALFGRSGAGKSTLINLVTGIDRPNSGSIVIAGQPLEALNEEQLTRWRGRHVGVVFQSFQLMPMLTCAQNVMLPMDFAGRYTTPQAQYARARALLQAVEIDEQADKRPADVSGGQRQRVAIARALANDPIFIAADEPTGSLDSHTAQAIVDHFVQLAASGTTILLATHDPELAGCATRILHLDDGRIVQAERR
jgi:putative ABC transport system ATP-binding protein